jgi:hypothetical protein
MRSTLTKSLIGALAAVVMSAGVASAADVLEAKIPFPFVVNGKSFPAGEYTIERANGGSSVLLIRGDHGNRTAAFVGTRPADEHAPTSQMPSLQFKKHENGYRLTAVWDSPTDGRDVMD